MGKKGLLLVLIAIVCFTVSFAVGYWVLTPEEVLPTELVGEEEIEPIKDIPPPQIELPRVEEGIAGDVENNEQNTTTTSANAPQDTMELIANWSEGQNYVSTYGAYVGIFKGQPGVGGILIEETDISIANLPEFEIHNLEQGIPFTTTTEKYSILEGLHFPQK